MIFVFVVVLCVRCDQYFWVTKATAVHKGHKVISLTLFADHPKNRFEIFFLKKICVVK
jgi:hypothetical protein